MSSSVPNPSAVANAAHDDRSVSAVQAPHPGAQNMPRWDVGELPVAPQFAPRNLASMVGPGLVMGAAAIGGGEWLTGPLVTTKYGGALFWLATVSILAQVVYNLEISRYTLYCGEPIFTGKFRVPPGPMLWLFIYLLVDIGALLPYLAVSAATPLAMFYLGDVPKPAVVDGVANFDYWLLKGLGCGVFLLAISPMVIGGKVVNALRWVMSFKLVLVIGFLLYLAVFYSQPTTWWEIISGFWKFGNVPIRGTLDSQGVVEAGSNIANVFDWLWTGRGLPTIDYDNLKAIALMVAISGSGGLTNTTISAYTRDQGWGMGYHVGAIPSIVGGQNIKLSHVGRVFIPDETSLVRWRGWLNHVRREQFVVWLPACFVGLALPSMLSVQFLPRGLQANEWVAAGMTASKVEEAVGGAWGPTFWFLTLICGFLVLSTSMITTADGAMRRWVDLIWTGLPIMRHRDPGDIRYVYFAVLCCFATIGSVNILLVDAKWLIGWAANLYNIAFGVSCWHVLAVNSLLLPRELRPSWPVRLALFLGGIFFLTFASITTYDYLNEFFFKAS